MDDGNCSNVINSCNKTTSVVSMLEEHGDAKGCADGMRVPVDDFGRGTVREEEMISLKISCSQMSRKDPSPLQAVKAGSVDAVNVMAKDFICDICGRVYLHKHSLGAHVRSHFEEMKFKCDICQARFCRNGSLTIHRKALHTTEKNFECNVCGKLFARNDSLTRHMRIHLGIKKFVCEFCGRAFTDRGNLDKHKYLHTGIGRFMCEVCGKVFHRKDLLATHIRMSKMHLHVAGVTKKEHASLTKCTVKFECELCGKKFAHRKSLAYHMSVHSEKIWKCKICAKEYALKRSFYGHVKSHVARRMKITEEVLRIFSEC